MSQNPGQSSTTWVKPPNLRALFGTAALALLISSPVQWLLASLGLMKLAAFLATVRLSPIGMILWILVLARALYFSYRVDQGLTQLAVRPILPPLPVFPDQNETGS